MSESMESIPWTTWLLRLQYFLIIILLSGLIGVRFSLLPFRTAFSGFGLALMSLGVLAVLAFLALLVSWMRGAHHWRGPAIKAMGLGILPIVIIFVLVGPAGFKVPAIHDITTDTEDPPEFVAAKAERSAEENTLDYGGPTLAQQQIQAYPDIVPLRLPLSTNESFRRVEAVCKGFGWRILRVDVATGVIEAVEETLVFGFKDDIIIRVLPTEEGSQIDVRSVSRVGVSDLGANAKRIRRVLKALKAA